MKKTLHALMMTAGMFVASATVQAQLPYEVTTFTEAYNPLQNAVSLNGTNLWSDTSTFVIPLGFNFRLGDTTTPKIVFSQGNLLFAGDTGTLSGFAMLGTSLQDRAAISEPSKSPVRYLVNGAAGNRIVKFEIANAGFTNETDLYGTNVDFVNVQVWFYEQNHNVEFRFGPSSITHFDDYFTSHVPLGFMRNLEFETFGFDAFYCLKGDPTDPGIDTVADLSSIIGFTSYPDSGRVYRFALKNQPPPGTSVGQIAKVSLGHLYPVPASDILYVESAAEQFEICSIAGAVIRKGSLKKGHNQLPIGDLAPGMYLLRMSSSKKETDIRKFVKQ